MGSTVAERRSEPISRAEGLALAALLLLAIVLRVGWPTLTEFKFSEARLAALALEVTREGRLPLVGVPSSAGFDHSPLSVYLYVPAFLLATDPVPATIYGGLAGAAAVMLCWWLARRWPGGGPGAAFIAATLLACSPWAVAFSRKIWQVTFVPLLTLLFVALVFSALVQERHWHLAWALFVFALLVQVHPSAISLAPALLLWLLLFWRALRLAPLLVGGLLGILSALPFLIFQIRSGWPLLAAYGDLPPSRWDLSAAQLAWEAITGQGIHALAGEAYPLLRVVPQLDQMFNLVGWLVALAALWLAWRTAREWRASETRQRQSARLNLILLTWLVVPVVFNLRHSLDLHLHFFALLLPVAYLLIGRAAQSLLVTLASGPVQWVLRWGSTAILLALALAQVTALLLMARFVASHETPGGFGTPLGRYKEVADQAVARVGREGAAEVLVIGDGDSVVVDATPAIFDVLLRDRVSYRFVDGPTTAVFPPGRTVALLTPGAGEGAAWYQAWPVTEARGAVEDYYGGYWLVNLDGSWPQAELEPIQGLRLFENGIELQGYQWQGDLQPGDQARLWLLWQVLWQSPENSHFSIQVLDAAGQQWAQQDSVGYPLAYRRKGDRILSAFDITIPQDVPQGPYETRVGVYLYPQVVNVPLVDGAGNPAGYVVPLGP